MNRPQPPPHVTRASWRLVALGVPCFAVGLGVSTALADHDPSASPDASTCHLYDPVEPEVLLRRLSLDLNMRVPSIEEYEALAGQAEVPEATLEALLQAEDFRQWARRFHMDLFWGNVDNVALNSGNVKLNTATLAGGDQVWKSASAGRRKKYRVEDTVCQDKPQTDIDKDYVLGDFPECEQVGNACLEGWVELVPYWHTEAQGTVKVCAAEAQTAAEGLNGTTVVACDYRGANASAECGCGPDLRWCYTVNSEDTILTAMQEQLLLNVDQVTVGGAPYSSMITSTTGFTNGTLQFWKKHLAPMANLTKTYADWSPGDAPLATDPVATDTTWVVEQRGPQHSGILTENAYSLRFATNRARANRFRIIFEGQYFQPPSIEDGSDCDPADPDITERCTCRQCHQVLEPLAASFSQIALAGSGLIDNLPEYDEDCIGSNNIACRRFYETQEDGAKPGWLRRLQYADDETPTHAAIKAHIEAGLPGLTEPVISSGTFARSMVIHLWTHFMGRPPILDPLNPNVETAQIDALSQLLRDDDDFRGIVRAIVSLDEYRRSR